MLELTRLLVYLRNHTLIIIVLFSLRLLPFHKLLNSVQKQIIFWGWCFTWNIILLGILRAPSILISLLLCLFAFITARKYLLIGWVAIKLGIQIHRSSKRTRSRNLDQIVGIIEIVLVSLCFHIRQTLLRHLAVVAV